jgi:hypothetical protein
MTAADDRMKAACRRAAGGAPAGSGVALAVLGLAAVVATPAHAQDTDPPVIRVLAGGVEISTGALSRPSRLGPVAALPTGGASPVGLDPVARFTYLGPALPATRSIGFGASPALSGDFSFDGARRLAGTAYESPAARGVLTERLAWTPRG